MSFEKFMRRMSIILAALISINQSCAASAAKFVANPSNLVELGVLANEFQGMARPRANLDGNYFKRQQLINLDSELVSLIQAAALGKQHLRHQRSLVAIAGGHGARLPVELLAEDEQALRRQLPVSIACEAFCSFIRLFSTDN